MLFILQKACEPRMRGAVADLGGAGLAAHRETREAVVAVDGDHIVAHQALHGLGRVRVYQQGLPRRLAVAYHCRLYQNPVVGDRRHIAQHRKGTDQVSRLPDAGPAGLGVTDKVQRIGACRGRDAVQIVRVQKAVGAHVVDHLGLPDHDGDLRKRDVARVCQRPGKVLGIVLKGTDDLDACDLGLALTEKGPLPDRRQGLDRRRCGDQLED